MPKQEIADGEGYSFAYLDEQTKRMIRRCSLKAVAVPGYQVPFGGREMPLPYGWGTGGMQVTASIIGRDDTLTVIDQGADHPTTAVHIRRFFSRDAVAPTNDATAEASIVQPPHRMPHDSLRQDHITVPQQPQTYPSHPLSAHHNKYRHTTND